MNISDIVAKYIMNILDESGGNAEIQRNELAGEIGCVPSQINYVITSRFTPEQGYIVESRRGGGGYIRITRITMDKNTAIMHAVNSIGKSIDFVTSLAIVKNLQQQGLLDSCISNIICVAISERSYVGLPTEFRDILRANLLKNMLLTQV